MKKLLLIALLLPMGVVSCMNKANFTKSSALELLAKKSDSLDKVYLRLSNKHFTKKIADSISVNLEVRKEILDLRWKILHDPRDGF